MNVAQTFEQIAARVPGLSAVVLRAKEKACLNDIVLCRPEACEFARDYPAKAHASGLVATLGASGLVEPDTLRDFGEKARACPFELSLDLSRQVDLVVGDANYIFDPRVSLNRGTAAEEQRWMLVIDEAARLDRAGQADPLAGAER